MRANRDVALDYTSALHDAPATGSTGSVNDSIEPNARAVASAGESGNRIYSTLRALPSPARRESARARAKPKRKRKPKPKRSPGFPSTSRDTRREPRVDAPPPPVHGRACIYE